MKMQILQFKIMVDVRLTCAKKNIEFTLLFSKNAIIVICSAVTLINLRLNILIRVYKAWFKKSYDYRCHQALKTDTPLSTVETKLTIPRRVYIRNGAFNFLFFCPQRLGNKVRTASMPSFKTLLELSHAFCLPDFELYTVFVQLSSLLLSTKKNCIISCESKYGVVHISPGVFKTHITATF
jgi:hypothetical protein